MIFPFFSEVVKTTSSSTDWGSEKLINKNDSVFEINHSKVPSKLSQFPLRVPYSTGTVVNTYTNMSMLLL